VTTDNLPDVLTIDETARILRISRGLAFAGARRGDIPAIRIGRRLLVPRAALMRLLQDDGDGARQ
jgi:excisionase family DNA binding protein